MSQVPRLVTESLGAKGCRWGGELEEEPTFEGSYFAGRYGR